MKYHRAAVAVRQRRGILEATYARWQSTKDSNSILYLHGLGRRVVMVVMRLVVLVPVVSRLDAVEVARLAGPELVVPPVGLREIQNQGKLCGVIRSRGKTTMDRVPQAPTLGKRRRK